MNSQQQIEDEEDQIVESAIIEIDRVKLSEKPDQLAMKQQEQIRSIKDRDPISRFYMEHSSIKFQLIFLFFSLADNATYKQFQEKWEDEKQDIQTVRLLRKKFQINQVSTSNLAAQLYQKNNAINTNRNFLNQIGNKLLFSAQDLASQLIKNNINLKSTDIPEKQITDENETCIFIQEFKVNQNNTKWLLSVFSYGYKQSEIKQNEEQKELIQDQKQIQIKELIQDQSQEKQQPMKKKDHKQQIRSSISEQQDQAKRLKQEQYKQRNRNEENIANVPPLPLQKSFLGSFEIFLILVIVLCLLSQFTSLADNFYPLCYDNQFLLPLAKGLNEYLPE